MHSRSGFKSLRLQLTCHPSIKALLGFNRYRLHQWIYLGFALVQSNDGVNCPLRSAIAQGSQLVIKLLMHPTILPRDVQVSCCFPIFGPILEAHMPNSFYQALVIFLPLAAVFLLARKYVRPNLKKRVTRDIENRLFAESPTFVVEDLVLEKNAGGFYTFRVEGLVASLTDGSVEIRIVEGSHSGTGFLKWDYQKPEPVNLKPEYSELYPKP